MTLHVSVHDMWPYGGELWESANVLKMAAFKDLAG